MEIEDLDVDCIHRAFSPAREIRDPRNFSGRVSELKDLVQALQNRGGFLAIFGLRGVGKTSIAMQAKIIAEGDRTLLNRSNLVRLAPKQGFSNIVHYYTADTFIRSTGELVQRILFGDENNPSLFDLTKAGNRRLEEFKKVVRVEGGASMFGAKIGASGSEESRFTEFVSDNFIQQFRALLGTIQRDNQDKSGLLILVDEFDTIEDKAGFSSIVKACSSDFVKFGVIGIATNVMELMRDHESIGRQIDTVRIPTMEHSELVEILAKAEYGVDHAITFDDDAKMSIATRAEGFPYFAHLLGKESMMIAFENGSSRVSLDDVESLYDRIANGRLSTIYEDIYHSAVKNSPQREILLKLFAERLEDEISTEEVYGLAKEMDITNPSQLMQPLTVSEIAESSGVLTKVRARYFRFTDPVFKVYARLRQWKYE